MNATTSVPRYWGIFLAVYFPMLTSLPLTIDAERAAQDVDQLIWVAQGRWGVYLILKLLFQHPVTPYFPVAFFGACLAVAYHLLVEVAKVKHDSIRYCGFAVLASVPLWSFIMEFPANTAATGLAVLATSAAGLLIASSHHFKMATLIGAMILIAFALGVYQSLIVAAFIFALALYMLQNRLDLRAMLRTLGAIVGGAGLYFVIQLQMQRALGVSLGYVDQFVKPDYVLTNPVTTIVSTAAMALGALGSPMIYGVWLWALPIVVVLAAAQIIWARRWKLGGVVAICMAAPFGIVFLAGGSIPARTLIPLPIAICFAVLAAGSISNKYYRRALVGASLLLAVESSYVVSMYQAQRVITDKFQESLASRIYARIDAVAGSGDAQKIDIFGSAFAPTWYPVGSGSTAAGSFFSWDNGNARRMTDYMTLLGYKVSLIDHDQRRALIPEFEKMPVWPAEGSVQLKDGVVMIRLSQSPGFYF